MPQINAELYAKNHADKAASPWLVKVVVAWLGRFADDYADVRRIFACLQTDLRADRVLNPHIAALLTIAVVLHHQPEEEEL